MKSASRLVAALIIIVSAQSSSAQTMEVKFRNQTGIALKLAVLYWVNSIDGWTSRGWLDLPNDPKTDFVLKMEGNNHSSIYYYAYQPGTSYYWGKDDCFFCIIDSDFIIPNALKIECEIKVPGKRVPINKEDDTYITLTGNQ